MFVAALLQLRLRRGPGLHARVAVAACLAVVLVVVLARLAVTLSLRSSLQLPALEQQQPEQRRLLPSLRQRLL